MESYDGRNEQSTDSLEDLPFRQHEPQTGVTGRPGEVTRREFVAAMGMMTGSMALGVPTFVSPPVAAAVDVADLHPSAIRNIVPVDLVVNGRKHNLTLDPRVTLLDLLREGLGLTGAKKGCDHGQCGACTVLANGTRINSCLTLAVRHDGDEITTIEGLAQGEELHPVQAAFLEHDGFQCGYCTPGQICSAVALLHEAHDGHSSSVTADLRKTGPADLTPEEIRERMGGNICRCGAYPGIVAAVQTAHAQLQSSSTGGARHESIRV